MEQLKQNLLNLVNERLNSQSESFLPMEAVYYVVKDFYRDVDDTYKNYLQQVELQKQQLAQQEQNKEDKQED